MPGKTRPAAAADRKFERRSDVRAAHVQHACRPHAAGPPAPHKLATFSSRAEVLGHAACWPHPVRGRQLQILRSAGTTLVDTYFRPRSALRHHIDVVDNPCTHTPLTRPPTAPAQRKNALRPFSIAVVAAVLLMHRTLHQRKLVRQISALASSPRCFAGVSAWTRSGLWER